MKTQAPNIPHSKKKKTTNVGGLLKASRIGPTIVNYHPRPKVNEIQIGAILKGWIEVYSIVEKKIINKNVISLQFNL